MSTDDRMQRRIADLERSAHQREDDSALVELLRAYLEGGRLAAALSKLEERLALGPAGAALLAVAAEAYQRSGEPDRALEWHLRGEEAGGTDPEYWTTRGRLCEVCGRLEEARAAHEQALEIEPDRPEALFRLGVTLMRMGLERDALRAFERCIEAAPSMVKAQINLGLLHDQLGESRRAIDCFRRALEIDPRSVESRLNLGASYGDLGMQKEAVAEFQAALEVDPSCVMAHFNLGVALLEEAPEEAQSALRRALTLEPGHWEASYHLGLLGFKRGQYDAAIRHFQQCLETQPDSVRALYHLGLAYNKKDQPGRAIDCLTRVCELDPSNSQAHFYLGVAHDKKGQYDKARLCYQAAERLKKP